MNRHWPTSSIRRRNRRSGTKTQRLAKVLGSIDLKSYAAERYTAHIKEEIKEKCDPVLKSMLVHKGKDIAGADQTFLSPYLEQLFGYL